MNNQILSKIWIVVIIGGILAGGILAWWYFGAPKKEEKKEKTKALSEVAEKKTVKDIDIEKYLHKDAIVRDPTPPPDIEYHAISGREAVALAIQHLKDRGVEKIQICEVSWIVAPLGGFLIDGKGEFTIEGKRYSTFRIGVRDGSEFNGDEELAAGKEFVFIARGEDEKGNVIWYPEPGPDYQPAKDEVVPDTLLDYEFLGQGEERQRFETLSQWCK